MIRDSIEDRQSSRAWQTINKVSKRKSTTKAKLKASNQQERIKLCKQHFENLLGNPPKVTHELITRGIVTLCGWPAKQTIPLSVLARNQTKGFWT